MAHPKQWINGSTDFALRKSWQLRGYVNGEALQGHINAQHGGKFSPDCPACRELERKTKAVKPSS